MALSARSVTALVACLAALPAASAAQSDTAGLGASVRQLVIESLNGGGTRPDQVLVAADSATAALLSLARISAVAGPGPAGMVCPGSTAADALAVQAPVGYVVQVVLSAAVDSTARRIHVSKGCSFQYRGTARGFQETGTWELRLSEARWYVARMLERSIT
jgi:hypothetical protein